MSKEPTDAEIARVVAAIEGTRVQMDAARDAIPRQHREPYFDKMPTKGPNKGKHIVGYRTKLLEAQARAAINALRNKP